MASAKILNFNKLVSETIDTNVDKPRLEVVPSLLETIEIEEVKEGFYTLTNDDETLDIPRDWGALSSIHEGYVVDLGMIDNVLNSIFEDFFAKEGVYKLAKNENGVTIIYAPKIKKAA